MNEEQRSELRRYMRRHGIMQQDIAEKMGVTQSYISAILTGKSELGKGNAKRMAEALGISEYWLLTGQGEMAPGEPAAAPLTGDKERIKMLEEQIAFLKAQIEDYKFMLQSKIK